MKSQTLDRSKSKLEINASTRTQCDGHTHRHPRAREKNQGLLIKPIQNLDLPLSPLIPTNPRERTLSLRD
jgi:hypothetical protein